MNSEIIGWIGSTIILISFIPKSVNKIRILNSVGCIVWIIYGFITKAPEAKVKEIRDRVEELNEILSGVEKRIEAMK